MRSELLKCIRNALRRVSPTRNTTIIWTVLLVLTLVTGIPIAKYATPPTPYVFFGVAYLFLVLAISFASINVKKETKWNSNFVNTGVIALLSIVVFPVLYYSSWYHRLNEATYKTTTDYVDSMPFPSFALFQRDDWSSQADITLDTPPKCFVGWYNATSAPCGANAANSSSCTCAGGWNSSIDSGYVWQGVAYNVLAFTSSEALMSTRPTLTLTAQAFFYYNASQSMADSSRASSPGLSIALHDPKLNIYQALAEGHTQLKLIDANAEVAINLGINLLQRTGEKQPYYSYDPDISTVPAMDLVCDSSNGINSSIYACYVNLLIQFPTFERTTTTSVPSMSWTDVVVEAGGWFSFFQILGWVCSGSSIKEE